MNEDINQPVPSSYYAIHRATMEMGFAMASDILTCSLLRTPGGSSWLLDGMDSYSTLISSIMMKASSNC